jgi:hypothetical protein
MFRRSGKPAERMATCWWRTLEAALLGALLCALVPAACSADDSRAASADLSNQAFALLNSLNAPDANGNANPGAKALLGPVASFAGDAQTLNQALGAADNAGARRATAALDADAVSVDAALKAHGGAIKADRWEALKHQLAAIEKSVPPAAASPAPPAASPPALGEPATASAPRAATMPLPSAESSSAAGAAADSSGPTIKIESRRVIGDVTHVRGYFEGSALKSAGIYEGEQSVKPLKVEHTIGRQKVEFQLSLRDADIATNLRVIDQAGRMATAAVFAEDSTALASTGRESGVEVDRGAGSTSGSNTAEIPSASAPPPGGLEGSAPGADGSLGGGDLSGGGLNGGALSGRGLGGGLGAPMGNIQVNITSINAINSLSHLYQVTGQIIGHGVRHAGIYVDGRLVKRLPVSSGANLSNFHTTFTMNGGTATIRAFSGANQYVESSIAMPPAVASAPPIVVAPYGINPYSPYGMNPYPVDPYGSLYGSPYGSPYGIPYGSSPSYGINISPYGITRYPINPYGASPYGAAPYGVNPYAAPTNPYNTHIPPMGPAGR